MIKIKLPNLPEGSSEINKKTAEEMRDAPAGADRYKAALKVQRELIESEKPLVPALLKSKVVKGALLVGAGALAAYTGINGLGGFGNLVATGAETAGSGLLSLGSNALSLPGHLYNVIPGSDAIKGVVTGTAVTAGLGGMYAAGKRILTGSKHFREDKKHRLDKIKETEDALAAGKLKIEEKLT